MAPKDSSILQEARERNPRSAPSVPPATKARVLFKAAAFTTIAGLASKISQLTLSPVYGSIPAGLYHANLVTFVVILAYIARRTLKKQENRDYEFLISPLLYWTLPIQFQLFQYSGTLGPVWGPMVTEAVTFLPVLFLTLISAGFAIDELGLAQKYGQRVADGFPALATFAVFSVAEQTADAIIPKIIGTSDFFTRTGLQLIAASLAALLSRSKLLAFAVPAMIHTMFSNPHHYALATTKYVNGTLYDYQYGLVDRRDSITGYISVVHNKKDGYLAMRCDHSMLGGEWLVTSKRKREGMDKRETVYAVFTMLEGVRLVKTDVFSPDDEKDGLFM
jgi:hypothetical protein